MSLVKRFYEGLGLTKLTDILKYLDSIPKEKEQETSPALDNDKVEAAT